MIIRGLPGSGKSFLAGNIARAIEPSVVLDPDAIDKSSVEYEEFTNQLRADDVVEALYPYRFLRSKAYAGIEKNEVIIWNQAFTHLDLLDRTIKNLQGYATEKDKQLPVLVIEVEIDEPTARERVAERVAQGGHQVDEAAFARFIADYKSFSSYEYPLITIDGAADVQTSVARILDALN